MKDFEGPLMSIKDGPTPMGCNLLHVPVTRGGHQMHALFIAALEQQL
jgi:hypothetical protein